MVMSAYLSVIVPVYNAEAYLVQCIESILSQSLEEIELILVDDGSEDNSGKIIDYYAKKDTRIRVFHQENKGPIKARLKGVLESKSNYVTFVDADDFVDSTAYVLAKELMQNNIDLIIFGITRYRNECNQRTEYCKFPEGIYDKREIELSILPEMIWDYKKERFGVDPSLCNKIIKKNILISYIQKLTFYEFHYGEDVAVFYPVLRNIESLAIIKKSYYYHRRRETAIPAYIADEEYLSKLYQLYAYLKQEFKDDWRLLKQVEYFYIYSAQLRKGVYGEYVEQIRYLFPFDKVKKDQKIIIYGAGAVGQSYRKQLEKIRYCCVVLWVDKNYERYPLYEISPVEKIKTVQYDSIIIAINNNKIRNEVIEKLKAWGVEEERIIYGQ